MTGALSALAVVAAIEVLAQATRPPGRPPLETGRASLSGRVTDDAGAPVAGAAVTLLVVGVGPERTGNQSTASLTSADGAYRFDRMPGGRYLVQAQRDGYASFVLPDGKTNPTFVAVTELLPDQHREHLDLVLPREGRIRGRVIDQNGSPVEGVSVGAGRMGFSGTFARTAITFRISAKISDKKDQVDGVTGPDGVYEVRGLPAGDLLVEARPSPIRNRAAVVEYHTAFYPDVASMELATPVRVEAGRVTSGIDIMMTGHPLSTLQMRVSPDPAVLTDLQLNVVAFPGKQIRSVMIGSGGVARVERLKEGRYAVWARARDRGRPMAAFTMLDFRPEIPEMALPLEAAGLIVGRVIAAHGGLPPVDGVRVETVLMFEGERVDHLAVDAGDVGPDGRFTLEGQFGARRVSVTGLPAGWQLREILLGRQDVTESAVEVPTAAVVDLVVVLDRR